jgi:peptide/nickel transport system permease protein
MSIGSVTESGLGFTAPKSSRGLMRTAASRFRRDPVAMMALLIFLLIVIFSLSAGLISDWTGFTPYENHLENKLSKPGENGYVLGADANGRDILTRLAYAGRVSITVAFLATASELLIGLTVGLIAGYLNKWVDSFLMRVVDVLLSIPTLPLLILVSTLYRPGTYTLAFLLALVFWPGDSRLIRGEALVVKNREFVHSARVAGASPFRIVTRHILPNVLPVMIVLASLTIPALILVETSLSFIGVGIQVPEPSWGNMLDEAQRFYRTDWTYVFFPGAMIFICALSLYLIGDGLRDAFDPRQSRR